MRHLSGKHTNADSIFSFSPNSVISMQSQQLLWWGGPNSLLPFFLKKIYTYIVKSLVLFIVLCGFSTVHVNVIHGRICMKRTHKRSLMETQQLCFFYLIIILSLNWMWDKKSIKFLRICERIWEKDYSQD